jgi:hypothetical protein
MVTTPGKHTKKSGGSMSFYRIVLSTAGLCVLLSFLALPTSCGEEKVQYIQVKFACRTTINVTDTGVDTPDAYVCPGNKVTWNANGHIFTVFFKGTCPFVSGCREIDNQKPTAGPLITTSSSTPTIYDYGIIVDGKLFDPHIIGGGN